MAFDADLEGAVAQRSRNAEQDIALRDLTIVQRHLPPLIDLAPRQLGRAGDAAAVFAAKGQINPLLAQCVQQRAMGLHVERHAAAIGNFNGPGFTHSQMSLVQSPPG